MKIITTVGTSLISNNPRVDCSNLENEKFSEALFDGNNDSNIKKSIASKEDELLKCITDDTACAELASLQKINPERDADVYLLCTETVTSYMCGRVLQRYLGERAKLSYIPDLRVDDAVKFESSGFFKLLEKVKEIKGDGNDAVVNISGGYKILIPPMTLIAQLEHMTIYYLYEDTDKCIEIGNLPISFDWDVIEEFVVYLHNDTKRINAPDEVINRMRLLKLVKNDSRELSIIGNLLKKYSDRESPLTYTIFGYFVEHKVAEYYQNLYGREKVIHSFNPFGKGTEDIDILVELDGGQFISAEIKPSYVLDDEEFLSKIASNMVARTNAAMPSKGTPKEAWLIVYTYTSAKTSIQLSEVQINYLKYLHEKFTCEIDSGIVFTVKHFFIEKNELKQERHIYQSFMKKSLKEITDLYSSSN